MDGRPPGPKRYGNLWQFRPVKREKKKGERTGRDGERETADGLVRTGANAGHSSPSSQKPALGAPVEDPIAHNGVDARQRETWRIGQMAMEICRDRGIRMRSVFAA